MRARYVLLFAALLFFWHLGGHDLWAPDEPYFAEGAREMLVDGKWAVPHVNGVVTPDKPPLFFWLIALFSAPLGAVTPWTARLPSVLAALGTLALTMRLGRRLFDRNTAAVAGLMLATTFMFWEKARWSQTDSLLCFLIWVALSAFEGMRSRDYDGRLCGLLFWGAAALAVLDKGPVGLLLPLGISLTVLAIDRDLASWRRFAPLGGPALFALVVGAWVAAATIWAPPGYSVWGALREHFVERGISGMHHRQPPWYFLTALPPNVLPWLGLVPGALLLAWRRRRSAGPRLALVATVFVLVFFTISTEKRELYALPALPALALMMGSLLTTVVGWSRGEREGEAGDVDRRWVVVGQGAVGALMAAAGLVLVVARDERLAEVPLPVIGIVAALLIVTGVATLAFALRGSTAATALAPGAGAAALYLVVAALVYPALEHLKSARSFTLEIQAATAASRAAGLPVLAAGLDNLPEHFAYYSNGMYTVETEDLDALIRHLERPGRAFAVVRREIAEQLEERTSKPLVVVASTRLARRDVQLVATLDSLDSEIAPGGDAAARPPT